MVLTSKDRMKSNSLPISVCQTSQIHIPGSNYWCWHSLKKEGDQNHILFLWSVWLMLDIAGGSSGLAGGDSLRRAWHKILGISLSSPRSPQYNSTGYSSPVHCESKISLPWKHRMKGLKRVLRGHPTSCLHKEVAVLGSVRSHTELEVERLP